MCEDWRTLQDHEKRIQHQAKIVDGMVTPYGCSVEFEASLSPRPSPASLLCLQVANPMGKAKSLRTASRAGHHSMAPV